MKEQDTIDLQKLYEIAREKRKQIGIILMACTLGALLLAFVLPKEYTSITLVRAKSQKAGSGISMQAAAAAALLGSGSMSNPIQSYMEMMKSRTVVDPIIAELDIPDEKKEKMTNKSFVKQYLKFENTKGTDLIEISATAKSPEEAQTIASAVVNNFRGYLTIANQSEQSEMVKFLHKQMELAKQDLEGKEKKLEAFSQQSKVYVPDEQAKALLKKLTELDLHLAKIKVENQVNQKKVTAVAEQLQQQNAAASQYEIADTPGIQELRKAIVGKQVQLIDLRQHYTDKHPAVIAAQNELDTLQGQLRQEVMQTVSSGTTTLNPAYMKLVTEKAIAEVEAQTGVGAYTVLEKQQNDTEKEIANLSANSVSYLSLARDVAIAQEVYTVLVKNYELTKVQEAMENMDVQVVDQADLPKNPSGPRKLLITLGGFLLGSIIVVGYSLFLYRKYTIS